MDDFNFHCSIYFSHIQIDEFRTGCFQTKKCALWYEVDEWVLLSMPRQPHALIDFIFEQKEDLPDLKQLMNLLIAEIV